jgi:hypothetical protein
VAALRRDIGRIERMDDFLYDDKLASFISQEKYIEKHEQFIAEKAKLKERLEAIDETNELCSDWLGLWSDFRTLPLTIDPASMARMEALLA